MTHERDSRLLRLLAEQRDFLRESCRRFDEGHLHEVKRIAETMRVLLHDAGRSSVSLLSQLNIKDKLRFLDTDARLEPVRGSVQVLHARGWPKGMVIVQLGNGVRYIPALGSDPESFTTQRPFEEWWTHVLVRSREGEEWDRGTRFVLGLAHKEGGAHVDPSPPAWWRAIRDGEWAGAGTTVAPDGRTIPIDSLVLAVVRQVGYEVEMTLQQQLPALLGGIPEIDRAQPPTNTGSIAFASFETPAPPRSPDE